MVALLFSIMFVFTGLFLWLEAGTLIKRPDFKQLFTVTLLLVLGWVYGVDYALDWQVLPNPKSLLAMLGPISDSFEKFFQLKS